LCLLALIVASRFAVAQVKHVVLISIDGLHPDMYLDKSWPCPNVRRLMREGTYADYLKSVFPSFTYPSHTAMVTGALPARSGIIYNQPVGSNGEWYWYSSSIRTPTLWQALKKRGMTSATVLWPVTAETGERNITWNVPDVWPISNPGDRATVTKKYATPGLMEELEQQATGRLDSSTYNEDYLSMDGQSGRIAAYILKTKRTSLLAVHFTSVDGMEHEHGRDADSVRIALASVDHAIGDILEAIRRAHLQDSTAVIVLGDHGFSTLHTVMRPNMLIKGVKATFIAAGGSAFLYRYRDTKAEDIPGIVKAITDSLNKLPKERRKLFHIIDRKELDRMGADSAAILALAAEPGMVFSRSVEPAKTVNTGAGTKIQRSQLEGVFIPTTGGHHGFDPELPDMYTGFVAWGAGIIKGGHIHSLSEPDIAPLIANLLGIEFTAPDGKLVPGIMKP